MPRASAMTRQARRHAPPALLALLALAFAPAQAAPAASGKALPLAKVQERLALPTVEATTNLVTISDGTNTVVFHPGFRRAAVNGVAVWLNEPAEPDYRATLRVSAPDLDRLLVPILSQISNPAPASGSEDWAAPGPSAAPLFIDPGHGGEDSGAIAAATGLREKDLVLDISLRVGELLRDAGFSVAFSRTNDTFVALPDRAALAAATNAALFASIHANTTGGAAAHGIETFTLSLAGSDSTSGDTRISKKEWPGNAHDAESAVLGYLVQSSVNTERGEADRGLRHARFQVLREAPCPAILIECGFLSNAAENTSLESPRYRQRVAAAIARALAAFASSSSCRRSPSDCASSPP